tara:strand:+ start:4653 stop:5021 length:369 start_codon:yes stop_codon:yes gene_type:complete
MTWEEVIKRHCGCGQNPCKTYGPVVVMEEKKLVGDQHEIDTNDDGKITGEDFKNLRKGKGERHFYIEDGKPVQWTGETHKHPDGTLMSGKEHVEGKSKKLFHFYELDDKYLRHLSKDTTRIE